MNLRFIVSPQTEPYLNLAVEQHLLSHSSSDEATLYLWRNRRTVVIGQNQNPFSEVNIEALLADHGFLVRRRTGGGAVYHDEGNLNFSFVVPQSLYDLDRQFQVVCQAVETFGLSTMRSGRNDILVNCHSSLSSSASMPPANADWRKFSGNAFSKGRTHHLHHGTLLISGNLADLQQYLQPKPTKLLKHGVDSVRSRVVNLADLVPSLTPTSLYQPLHDAFAHGFGQQPTVGDFAAIASLPEVQALRSHLASDEWLYAPWRTFSAKRSGSFSWGEVDVAITISDGLISDLQIATDALDLDALEQARQHLIGASSQTPPTPITPLEADLFALIYP